MTYYEQIANALELIADDLEKRGIARTVSATASGKRCMGHSIDIISAIDTDLNSDDIYRYIGNQPEFKNMWAVGGPMMKVIDFNDNHQNSDQYILDTLRKFAKRARMEKHVEALL